MDRLAMVAESILQLAGILPIIGILTIIVLVIEGIIPAAVKQWNGKAYHRDVNRCLKSYRNY